MKELEKSLTTFAKELKRQSRSNLTRTKKSNTKALYNSIDYVVKETKNAIEFDFLMLPYGDYVDAGVSGTERKYDTPHKYTNKKPPVKDIYEWVRGRNLNLRNEKGQFKKGGQMGLAYIIRNKIFTKGMKPTHFFSKPFKRLYKTLPSTLAESYVLDAEALLKTARKSNPNTRR